MEKEKRLREYFFKFSDINLGIILISTFIFFDFGAFQGVFEIVNNWRLPFVLAAVSVFYALYLLLANINELKHETTKRYVLFSFFLIIYSQISSFDPDRKITFFTETLQYLANYIILVRSVKKPSQFIIVIDVFLASIIHSSFHAAMQGGKLYDSNWLRDENHISLLAAMAIPFAFILFNEAKSNIKKLCYIIGLIFYFVIIVVASSRGGALAMMVGSLLSLRLYKNRKLRNMVIAFLVVILIISFGTRFVEEMGTLKQGTEEKTASARIYFWSLAMEMFSDNPVMGVGPNNYPELFSKYDYAPFNPEHPEVKYVAHSTPIQWLAEMGIIGSAVLYILLVTLYRNWKSVKNSPIQRNDTLKSDNLSFLKNMNHACGFSQVAFWTGALFLSLIGYPFFYILVPFSELSRRLYFQYQ